MYISSIDGISFLSIQRACQHGGSSTWNIIWTFNFSPYFGIKLNQKLSLWCQGCIFIFMSHLILLDKSKNILFQCLLGKSNLCVLKWKAGREFKRWWCERFLEIDLNRNLFWLKHFCPEHEKLPSDALKDAKVWLIHILGCSKIFQSKEQQKYCG